MTEGTSDWLARRRRYRRLSYAVLAVGIIGFLLADFADYPVVGVAVYWAGFVGFVAILQWAPVALFDERDRALERQASYDTVRVVAVALVVLAPGATTLDEVGYYEMPAVVEGVIWGYAALFAVFGAAYLVRRYRP